MKNSPETAFKWIFVKKERKNSNLPADASVAIRGESSKLTNSCKSFNFQEQGYTGTFEPR
jgi:hypothetical protein